jgi:hypothetical protein
MTDAPPPSIQPRPQGGGRNGRRTVSSRKVPVDASPADAGASGAEPIIAPAAPAAPAAEVRAEPVDIAPIVLPGSSTAPDQVVRQPEPPSAGTDRPAELEPSDDGAAPAERAPVVAAPAAVASPDRDTHAAPASAEPDQGSQDQDDHDDPAGEDEGPTPLAAAVTATSSWLRRAGTATTATVSSAYASISRTAPKEDTMTSTSTGSAPMGASAPAAEWPDSDRVQPIAMGNRPPVASSGPRRVRLVIARVDPWSVMKLSFLLSFALGIIGVVATAVVWFTLDGLHVFANVDNLVTTVAGAASSGQVLSYLSFGKVVAGSMLVGVVDVFLLTALATIGAFLYNIVAALVGGLHVSMTDE